VHYAASPYRTVLSAVIYGALGQADREALMAAYVNYLLDGAAVAEQPAAVRPHLDVSPNPVKVGGVLRLISPSPGTAALYDAFGRRRAEQEITGNTDWRLDRLPAGSYVLRLSGPAGVLSRPVVVCR